MSFSEGKMKKMGKLLPPQELSDIMKRCGMTQVDVATYLCISRSAVCCWLRGRRKCEGPAAILLRLMDEANTKMVLRERKMADAAKQVVKESA